MPGLRLNVGQAARLFSIGPEDAGAVLSELHRATILARSEDGVFALTTTPLDSTAMSRGALRDAPIDRFVCLLRHWTWANEALARFERELAEGWNEDDDPMSDHPFGSYYHWCALLCGFSEAAIDHGLLSPLQLEPIRQDIESCLPSLRACRQILVAIPASLEEQPLVAHLIRDDQTLARLRRVHHAFGEALRREQTSREIDSLDL